MIHDIARSAGIRKTQKDVNIMTGNYEAAFALGLLSKICQVTVESQCRSVADMKAQFFEKADGYEPRNEREQILNDFTERCTVALVEKKFDGVYVA